MTAFLWSVVTVSVFNIWGATAVVRRDGVDAHALFILCIYSAALAWAIYLLAGDA